MSAKPAKPAATVTHLAAARAKTLRDLDDLKASLLQIDADLIAQGPGRYQDETGAHVFQVIAATEGSTGPASYVLPDGDDAEEQARKLSGEQFKQLFDRSIIHTPCEGFELLVPKLLTPAAGRDLLALCLVPGKTTTGKAAYVKKG